MVAPGRGTSRSTDDATKAGAVADPGRSTKVVKLSSVSDAVPSTPKSKGGRPRAGKQLTTVHLRTIDAFIESPNKAEIARKLRISESQVARTLKLPVVRDELARRTDELKQSMAVHMRAAGPKAFDTLIALLDDPNPVVRLRTATYIVDRLLSLPALGSEADAALEARIVEVTGRVDAAEHPGA
jgi:hypothetical protein